MQGAADKTDVIYVGGAGSGKTTRLCEKVAGLNHTLKETQILYLAFHGTTMSGAKGVMQKTGGRCLFATPPGLCLGLIAQYFTEMGFAHKPVIITKRERRALEEEAVTAVNERMFPTELGYEMEVQAELAKLQTQRGQIGMIDLPKFIAQHLHLNGIKNYLAQFQCLLVDDAQELSPPEWYLLQKLKLTCSHLFMAADLSASVNQETIARKISQLPGLQVLHKSYRCKPWITEGLNQLSSFGPLRNPQPLTSAYESRIVSQNYQVNIDDMTAQHAWLVRQVSNCLQANPSVTIAIAVRSSSEANTLGDLLRRHNLPHQILHLRSRFAPSPNLESRVVIGTAFDLKGLEFTVTFVTSMVEGQWPYFKEDPNHARNQLLTIFGRTQSALFLLCPRSGLNSQATRPSRFLRELNTPEVITHQK
jgi:superfamily I DNA/RNA helicase